LELQKTKKIFFRPFTSRLRPEYVKQLFALRNEFLRGYTLE
jgi:hypothetical protein